MLSRLLLSVKTSRHITSHHNLRTLLILSVLSCLCLSPWASWRRASSLNDQRGRSESTSIRASITTLPSPALVNSSQKRTGSTAQKPNRFNPLANPAILSPEASSLFNANSRCPSHVEWHSLSNSPPYFSRPQGRAPPPLT